MIKIPMTAYGRNDQTATPSLAWKRLLNKVDKDPDWAFKDSRCLDPYFLGLYFDLCDGKALEAPYVAEDYADVAGKLAEKTGDPHLIHRAAGVTVHALIGNSKFKEAEDALDAYRSKAFDCCDACAADWLMRQGDLVVETADPQSAKFFLEFSAATLGGALDDDTQGRLLFLRGIAHHCLGDCAGAIDAAGRALELLSSSTPKGYFLDCVSFLACFLEHNDDRQHDEAALAYVDRFRERLKGLRRWHEVRDRTRWVEGQILARLDQPRRARARLETARKGLTQRAPHHWALACAIDEALICGRRDRPELYDHSIRQILKACADNLKLDAELAGRLERLRELMEKAPWEAKMLLSQFRRSFFTPVPGLLADLNAKSAMEREWPYGNTRENAPQKVWYSRYKD